MDDHAADELQRLYNSEINFSLETFCDRGWRVRLGDPRNGFKAETAMRTFDEAAYWLRAQARIHFPESGYVKCLAH